MENVDENSDLPRLLLLSRTPPGDANVGQLFLRDLCESYPPEKMAFGVVQSEFHEADYEHFPEVPKLYLRRDTSRKFHRAPEPGREFLSHLAFRAHALRNDGAIVDDLVRFGREHRVDKVWAVLNSPLLYRIAPRVSARLDVPLVAMIWDPPDGVGLHFGLDRLSRALLRKQFATAMTRAERCAVVSERMASEYRALYGKESAVVRHGIADSEKLASQERDESEFRIGFCGNAYAQNEWMILLRALDRLCWQVDGRPIRLIIAGFAVPFLVSYSAARVDYLGWRCLRETLEIMGSCHIGYLPYWLDAAHAEPARLCFAGKLTTYLTAGLPVLYHGPREAAVADFFTRFPASQSCDSLDPAAVAAAICALADDGRRQQMAGAARQAVSEELNRTVFLRRFRQAIAG